MARVTKSLELRPNRSLLNSDFDGYKLSLKELPTTTHQLELPVDRLIPDENHYSLMHANLFLLQNHLIPSKVSDSLYIIDKAWNVQKYKLNSQNQFIKETVWQIPLLRQRRFGDYNVSMKVITEDLSVISNGLGTLYLLDKWDVAFSGEVIGPEENFIISDAVVKLHKINILLLKVKQDNNKKITLLYWVTLVKDETWNQVAIRQLSVEGVVQYCSLEPSCEAVYVVSENGCKFTLDSEKEIKNEETVPICEKKYSWTQTKEDLTIKFSLAEAAILTEVKVKTNSLRNIEVEFKGEVLLTGNLYKQIEVDLTTWTVTDNVLEIVLQKSEEGLMWPEIVEGDSLGDYVANPALLNEISERLASLTSSSETSPATGTTFNSQQVEECDFECDRLSIFERLCLTTHEVTHRSHIGSHIISLAVNLDNYYPPAIGVRFDVDTCIWQPVKDGEDFSLEHMGTLLAMGYIQASKPEMKYFTCAPDFSYSVICESMKHLFVYCQNQKISTNSELRNRSTGQKVTTLAQQYVLNLPSNDEILGIYASSTHLYVLRENFVSAFTI